MLLYRCNFILPKLRSTVFIDFRIQPGEAHLQILGQILL